MQYLEKFQQIAPLIGNTPLLAVSYRYKGSVRTIYAKAESYNLTGSIKDRVAYYILKQAYESGTIQPSDKIAEATSGNTGISFSALGSYLGHQVLIYMPDWMSVERINLMKSYGAQVRLVSREEGGFLGSIAMTEKLAENGGVFLPRQFSNPQNIDAHIHTTGEEIVRQLQTIHIKPDGIVAGVGTGGTVMGIGKRLQMDYPDVKVCPLEPASSPTLSTGYKVGNHRIQGISDEFVPDILDLDALDEVVSVDDGDSIVMSRMLSSVFGLGVGISSGANFLGCVMMQNKYGGNYVTVFADDNKKYLSTDYSDPVIIKDGYLTKDIELLGVTACR